MTGQIVGAFIMPHDPLIFAAPDAASPERKARVMAAFERIAERMRELQTTTAIVVGADHYVLFGPQCLPRYLIGVGDVWGPVDRLQGIDQGPIDNNEALAVHIMNVGFQQGFDWSVAKSLQVDHAIGIPVRQCVDRAGGVRTIPVYLASGVEPLITSRRAYELGGLLKRAVESFDTPERVVVIGSGGISHWVGLPQSGTVNEEFDRMVLSCIERGDAEELIALRDADIAERAGNGAWEVRNFLCAMGAVPHGRGNTIAYEPAPEWVTGLGFAEIIPSRGAFE